MKSVYMWTWAIHDSRGKWVLCRFAAASKHLLVQEGPPSPEAIAVRIKCTRQKAPPKPKKRRK